MGSRRKTYHEKIIENSPRPYRYKAYCFPWDDAWATIHAYHDSIYRLDKIPGVLYNALNLLK